MAIALMAHSDKDGRRRSTVPRRRNSFGTDWRYVLLFAALLIPFFEPTGFIRGVVPEVAGLFKVWRVATVAALVCLCIRHGSKDAFSLIAIAITALMFLSTLINEGAGRTWIYVQCFYDWAPLLVSVLLVNYAYRDRMTELLWAILVVTGVLSICNTISVLGWPQGVVTGTREPSNFYGHKNASIDLALPSVGCSLLLDAQRGRRCSARSVALFAIGLVQCIVSYSATSVVALALFPVLFVAVQFRKTRPAVNGFSCFGGLRGRGRASDGSEDPGAFRAHHRGSLGEDGYVHAAHLRMGWRFLAHDAGSSASGLRRIGEVRVVLQRLPLQQCPQLLPARAGIGRSGGSGALRNPHPVGDAHTLSGAP